MKSLVPAAASAMLLASATHVVAIDMYATNHLGEYPNITNDELIRFDPEHPDQYITIGSLGVDGVGFGGLEFDADGNLWAYASFYHATGGAASGLYSVNTDTGQATPQGSLDPQSLQDLAWNPANNTMYGVNTQQATMTRLYTVNLTSGDVELVGLLTGFTEEINLVTGIAFDAEGNLYIHEQFTDSIFKADASDLLSAAHLYQIEYVNVGSQGITVDWSRDNTGYHGMVAQGVFPDYLSQINTFTTDGNSYVYGTPFGENFKDGIPPVQAGDLAIPPASEIPGDVNGDEVVDTDDLLAFLAAWGNCPQFGDCPADMDGNGIINTDDLLFLLANWTP